MRSQILWSKVLKGKSPPERMRDSLSIISFAILFGVSEPAPRFLLLAASPSGNADPSHPLDKLQESHFKFPF